jgi:hypothetical protein
MEKRGLIRCGVVHFYAFCSVHTGHEVGLHPVSYQLETENFFPGMERSARYATLPIQSRLLKNTIKWGHAVAQLIEELCYKPEGHGFGSLRCHWNFSLI